MSPMYLTDRELQCGASGQGAEWTWDNEASAVHGGTPPTSSGESTRTGSLDHLTGGGPLSIMLPRPTDSSRPPRRDVPNDALSVTTLAPEPSYAEFRARCLLALALLNHRASPTLSAADVTVVRGALLGEWDA